MPIDEAAKFEIDFRLRQKEGEFQQAIAARQRRQDRGAGRRRRRRAGTAGEGHVDRRQPRQRRGDDQAGEVRRLRRATPRVRDDGVHRRRFRLSGPRPRRRERAAARCRCPRAQGSGRALRADADDSGQRAHQRAVLASQGRGRPLHVRCRRAVRTADAADAVLRAGDAGAAAAARRVIQGAAGASTATRATSSAARSGSDLLVVPAFSVRVSPEVAIVPSRDSIDAAASATAADADGGTAAGGRGRARPPARPAPRRRRRQRRRGGAPTADREIRVTVAQRHERAAETSVKLELPQGWSATPARAAVKFARGDESQTVRFMVKPAASMPRRRVPRQGRGDGRRQDVRPRLSR